MGVEPSPHNHTSMHYIPLKIVHEMKNYLLTTVLSCVVFSLVNGVAMLQPNKHFLMQPCQTQQITMRAEPKIVMGLLFLPQIDLVNPVERYTSLLSQYTRKKQMDWPPKHAKITHMAMATRICPQIIDREYRWVQ